ncbi:MAG TPA: tRNA (adenosine(37)-N6)-dimethylallyltransferase MiaA [Nocardioidaceae bacterium]|nr:tRNA (adenosine(37)-N6)-dimethylallyltransferase MiaA [Nocardioidaceae bacterium]
MTPVPIVAVVGPTAAGKTSLSLDIAEAVGGEIVNTDSMQVYRGMDIGTAKLPVEERRGIPHHLLDILSIQESATVAEFQQRAREVIEDCRARGVTPVLVGGSALYTRAVLDEFEFPGTDPDVRARLEDTLAEVGALRLHQELAAKDPVAAQRIIPSNGRRIVRALEVIEITGGLFSAVLPSLTYHYDGVLQVGVDIPREVLDERIEQRVQHMWDEGFVDEVRALERLGLREARTASAALGYQQVLGFLANELSETGAQTGTVQATRRFARKQQGWYRKDPRILWVGWGDPTPHDQVLAALRDTSRAPEIVADPNVPPLL